MTVTFQWINETTGEVSSIDPTGAIRIVGKTVHYESDEVTVSIHYSEAMPVVSNN